MFNDVVVIVLYQTVKSYQEDETLVFTTKTAFNIIGSFISLCLMSVLVGALMGFVVTYILKKFRYVSHSAIHETFLLVCCAMMSYFLSEILGQSGITSLVSCALVMAHYSWYNLSPQGKHVTSITFQTFGYGAEAFVFSFIGLSLMFYIDYPYSWQLIIAGFFIVIIGRFAGIAASYYMFECFKGDKSNKLTFREVSFLTFAAFIRGAIAFGLVENLDEHTFPHKKVIVSTTLCLVIASTIIFGSFTPMIQKFLLPSSEGETADIVEKLVRGSHGVNAHDNSLEFNFDENSKDKTKDRKPETFAVKNPPPPERDSIKRGTQTTHYEDFRHPNMMTGVSQNIDVVGGINKNTTGSHGTEESVQGAGEKGCLYYFRKFDD